MELYRSKFNILTSTAVKLGASASMLLACGHAAEAQTHPSAKLPVAAEAPASAIKRAETTVDSASAANVQNHETANKIKADLATAFQNYPGEIEVAVRDQSTGEVIDYTNLPADVAPTKTYNTASTLKLAIAIKKSLQAQVENRPLSTCDNHPEIPMPTQLTCDELDDLIPEIEESDDDAASRLWTKLGGAPTLDDFYHNDAHESSLTVAEPNGQWGWTQSKPTDQINTAAMLSDPNSPLSTDSKALINFLLDHVDPQQRWGSDGAAPADTKVREKQGWMPSSAPYGAPDSHQWTINSIGIVEDGRIKYDIVINSDNNATMQSGIDTINAAGRVVRNDMTAALTE